MNENNIISALNSYNGSQESLQQTVAVLTQELGEDWTTQVFQKLGGLSSDLKEKLNHVFNYYASLTAWQEAQAYLSSSEPLSEEVIQERLPVLKHWLDFFGQPGQDLYNQLEDKINQVPAEPEEESVPPEEKVEEVPQTEKNTTEIPQEKIEVESEEVVVNPENPPENKPKKTDSPEIFTIKKAVKEIALLDNLQSWLSARCLKLGDIEVFAYPYYGLVVDFMRQTVKAIQMVEDLQTTESIAEFYSGGLEGLKRKKQAIEADIQTAVENCESDTTALIDKNVDLEQVKKTLGALDESTENEYLGPAPDGFELMEDETPLDEKAVKEQYQQLEEQVKEKMETEADDEKKTSQTAQNSVQRKLSFSLKPKKS